MALLDAVRTYSRRYPDDDCARALSERFRRERPPIKGGPRILVQGAEDAYYFGIFGHIVEALRARGGVNVDLYLHTSFSAAVGVDWRSMLTRGGPLLRLRVAQWTRLYAPVVDRVGYRSADFTHPIGDDLDLLRCLRAWKGFADVAALERFTIDGVLVGDLVIDSYLRFRPSPRTRLEDPFLVYVLWQAHREVRRARDYFRRARPLLYLTSYSTYVQHGVAVRVALLEGVPVLGFGNLQSFVKRLTVDDAFHTKDPRPYRRSFVALNRKEERLEEARQQLELRLSGGVDTATAYMSTSAYAGGDAPVPDVRDAVVIFLHDFYDSPHVYADLVFPDFWAWICFTIETLEAARVPFFVKTHPNQIALSAPVLDELKARYPHLRMISPNVTNRQLADAGMASAVTMYGTVAHEAAYLGVPSIACARHPHVAFDFCRTARDKVEYRRLLENSTAMPVDRETMRHQALEFYYMHNLDLSPDERALRNAMIACWRTSNAKARSPQAVVEAFEALAREPAFMSFADELARELAADA